MSVADHASVGALATPALKPTSWIAGNWGLLAAVAALIAVLLLPTPEALPVARMP